MFFIISVIIFGFLVLVFVLNICDLLSWLKDFMFSQDKNVECGLARQQGIKDIFGMMSVGKGEH